MPTVLHIPSLADLRRLAPAWDDLWQRSDTTRPTSRAELVAQWVEQFGRPEGFHALVVEDQGRWIAALPLVRRPVARVLDAFALPANFWSSSGDLLWDAALLADPSASAAAADTLAAAFQELPCQLLCLTSVPAQRPAWQALGLALARAGMAAHSRPQWQAGWLDMGHDWESYRGRWPRKHRQAMGRHLRRLSARGQVAFQWHTQFAPGEIAPLLRRAFEVEDLGWKGDGGTSVLRTPGMFDFFLEQARQLAEWGQLALAFLESDGRPIAFAFGPQAKGVFHSCKIGYDPEFADYSPGQLLRYCLLERFFNDPDCRAVDFVGPLTAAHACWLPGGYAVERWMIAPRQLLGRLALGAYRWVARPADRKSHQPAHA